MTVPCRSCGKQCEDYAELALHISTSKRGHQRGKKWAANYLLRTKSLNKKAEIEERNENRTELTEGEKEAKRSTRLELSGQVMMVNALCPQCKTKHLEALPVEYARSPHKWVKNGLVAILCIRCRR